MYFDLFIGLFEIERQDELNNRYIVVVIKKWFSLSEQKFTIFSLVHW